MTPSLSTSLLSAENDVKESTQQVEDALNDLKTRIDQSMVWIGKIAHTTKSPLALLGVTFLVGIFFGQLMKIAVKQKEETKNSTDLEKELAQPLGLGNLFQSA